jgi:hypothetical protein
VRTKSTSHNARCYTVNVIVLHWLMRQRFEPADVLRAQTHVEGLDVGLQVFDGSPSSLPRIRTLTDLLTTLVPEILSGRENGH